MSANKGELIPLFYTPMVKIPLGRDFTKLETDCFQNIPCHKDSKQGMQNHQSKDAYLFDNHSDTLNDIKKFCEQQLKIFLEEIEGVDTDLAGLRITQSWLNKTKPGESHHSHFHPNSYLSAVLYISCLPKDYINIEKSHRSYNNIEFPLKKTTEWNVSGLSVRVTEGDLIIFPSWVRHNVSLNKTKNRERISLAFNTFPIGEMGTYENVTLIKL